MLILSRKIGESIVAGDNLLIKVLEIRGSYVRFGLVAPDDVRIYRDEILPVDHPMFPIVFPKGAEDGVSTYQASRE